MADRNDKNGEVCEHKLKCPQYYFKYCDRHFAVSESSMMKIISAEKKG